MLKPTFMVTLLLTLAACTSPPADPDIPDPTPELATCPSTIVIDEFKYKPDNCQVAAGTTITFLNKEGFQHTATSRSGAPVPFDTGTMNKNDTATVTFSTAGVYPYYCTFHKDMEASITVK